MGHNYESNFTIKIDADAKSLASTLAQVKQDLNALTFDKSSKLNASISLVEGNIKSLQRLTSQGLISNGKIDTRLVNEINETFNTIKNTTKEIGINIGKLDLSNIGLNSIIQDLKTVKNLKEAVFKDVSSKVKAENFNEKSELTSNKRVLEKQLQNLNFSTNKKTLETIKQDAYKQKGIDTNILKTYDEQYKQLQEKKIKIEEVIKSLEEKINDPNYKYNTRKGEGKNKTKNEYNNAIAARDEVNAQINQLDTNKTDTELQIQKADELVNEYIRLKTAIADVNNKINELKQQENNDIFTKQQEQLNKYLTTLQETYNIDLKSYGIDPASISSWDDLISRMELIQVSQGPQVKEIINQIKESINSTTTPLDNMKQEFDNTERSITDFTSKKQDIDQFTNRLLHFFSLTNGFNLLRRSINQAVTTIKDLDAVMTEAAVVTENSVSDMWDMLNEYADRANQLGVTIHDAYESVTLFLQQGLSMSTAIDVSNESLKLARIAGLEAAEATDRLTNAMRGFNMEVSQASAQNVNDVYSAVAAKTASDVNEISVAMTKVASLAASANMQFENTAAFLAKIIETTRESAETAGTALKTVVARFSEVKELYSEGTLLGTDEAGNEVDVNKISSALRTAGIDLNEYLTGMKGLDDIMIELGEKWDDLTIVQQRY